MAVVEVEGVIPTLAMDVEHTVIVLWVEVEVILLLVPAFWSLWRANTVAIIAKTGAVAISVKISQLLVLRDLSHPASLSRPWCIRIFGLLNYVAL